MVAQNPPAMWDTWIQPLSWEDPLEEGMANHSSILAWRSSPWTEEPGGLQSMGSKRVKHDSATQHVDHHFICLSASRITSLIRCLFRHFAHFLIVYFLQLCFEPFVYFGCQLFICILQIFSPNLSFVFSFFQQYFPRAEVFNFNEPYQLFLSWIMLLVYLKTHCEIQGLIAFLLCYFLEFL